MFVIYCPRDAFWLAVLLSQSAELKIVVMQVYVESVDMLFYDFYE